MILLDSNLLIRVTRSHDPLASVARAAIQTLFGRGERLIIVPQNLYEFWAVATRQTFNAVDFRGLPTTIVDPLAP